MTKVRGERWLRWNCYAGALVDGFMLVPMLFPKIGGALFGQTGFNPGPDYRYAMQVAASLMAGWTCLLLWASRRPLERKGVILLTAVPVLGGLISAGVYAVARHFIAWDRMAPTWGLQILLTLSLVMSYIYSGSRPIQD